MVLYDRANRRGKVDEIEDKESSDEERFILPYNDVPDDSVESEGSDSTETERLPAQKKRGSLVMILTMTVLRYSMKVLRVRMEGGIVAVFLVDVTQTTTVIE